MERRATRFTSGVSHRNMYAVKLVPATEIAPSIAHVHLGRIAWFAIGVRSPRVDTAFPSRRRTGNPMAPVIFELEQDTPAFRVNEPSTKVKLLMYVSNQRYHAQRMKGARRKEIRSFRRPNWGSVSPSSP